MSKSKKTPTSFVVSQSPDKIELTAYQGGQAVVRERRTVKLPKGKSDVALEGLPEQFVQGSLTIDSVEGKGQFKLGPISYRAANLSLATILQNSIDQEIDLIETTPQGMTTVSGTLKYILNNQAVLQIGKAVRIVPLTPKVELRNGLPSGLTSKPSLLMEPTVAEAGEFGINILYEAGGINWGSRYEAFYDAKTEKLSRLTCWVDLENSSGGDLDDATFKLIAGANYSTNAMAKGRRAAPPMALAAAAPMGGGLESADFVAESASAESVGEQKMYTLPDSLTLANGESKQTVLVAAMDVPVTPEYVISGGYYNERGAKKHEDAQKEPVYVRLSLKNAKASNLGVALPPGAVTVFERDSSGSLQKTDGASISHVAEDEQFRLQLRNPSKDIKVTRILIDSKQDPEPPREQPPVSPQMGPTDAAEAAKKKPEPRFREEEREFVVHNFKDKEVTVSVTESIPHDAKFLSKSENFTAAAKKSGNVQVTVAAKGTTTVRYRIKFQIG